MGPPLFFVYSPLQVDQHIPLCRPLFRSARLLKPARESTGFDLIKNLMKPFLKIGVEQTGCCPGAPGRRTIGDLCPEFLKPAGGEQVCKLSQLGHCFEIRVLGRYPSLYHRTHHRRRETCQPAAQQRLLAEQVAQGFLPGRCLD